MIDLARERYYDSYVDRLYAASFAQRERPQWDAVRPIQVTVWIEQAGRLYWVRLPPSQIMRAS